MNGQLYFEQKPWAQAMALIRQQALGDVVEVSVQVVCAKGTIESTADAWKEQLEELLGACAQDDVLRCEGVYSSVAAYASGAVARMFIDEGSSDLCENFEIVTQKALLVWKPGTYPQGRALASGSAFCDCTQRYSAELEVSHCG